MQILLTGSTRGIGKAISELLLKNDYSVIGTSRSTINNYTNNTLYQHIECDLADPEQVTKLKKVFSQDEIPEVLINNAAIFEDADFGISDEKWLSNWGKTMQVNLRSAALLCKWAVNAWMERGISGRIINIASRAGQRGDTQEYVSYAASKAGLIAITKTIARSFGKAGITAYSIAPGFVNTEMAMDSIKIYGEEYLTKDLALNEIVPPSQIAELVLLLASGKLTHATGQTFHINSGSYLV